jgi:hypothetical protein
VSAMRRIAVSPGRNLDLERELLKAIVRLSRRMFGASDPTYVQAVEERLVIGAERYGDTAFLGRDNLAELLEETPDVAGYALLELQRLDGRGGTQVRDDLLRVAVCGAAADYYARRALDWRTRMEARS